MKKVFVALSTLFVFTTAMPPGVLPARIAGPATVLADETPNKHVVVYQFHRRFRCDACYTLEKAINETLETHFQGRVAEGKLVYRVVDLDDGDQSHYEKRYDFFYNTVIVALLSGDEDLKFKNIEKVWQLTDKKEELMEFVRSEVEEYLEGL